MLQNIELVNNKGFRWYKKNNIFVKGYFFDKENSFYEKENLIKHFWEVKNSNDFIEKLNKINGIYSVIIRKNKEIYIASDKTRMFTLFYYINKKNFIITDNIASILKKKKLKISKINAEEFKATAHTVGKDTLFENVFQLQSSQYIVFKDNRAVKENFFFDYSIKKINDLPFEKLFRKAIIQFENTFKRFIKSLKNRQVALPLSGGYDSRLIAVMLKKINYKNVLCFTYGRKNNFEIENSQKTAKILNYKWVFIEYNKKIIGKYIEDDEFKSYANFAGKFCSMPFLQEYFAVKYLNDNKIVDDNAVFVPGHSGDFIGGSQLIKTVDKNIKLKNIVSIIYDKKFTLHKLEKNTERQIKQKIKKQLELFENNDFDKYNYSIFENYDLKEKIAKFIFNSSSVYNFFGYEHRFPFWDDELVYFFGTLPFELKKNKLLYDMVLKKTYFKIYNINFENEIQPTFFDFFKYKIKTRIKKYMPYRFTKKEMEKMDWMMYKEITEQMINFLENKNINFNKKVNAYNAIITQWYVEFISA